MKTLKKFVAGLTLVSLLLCIVPLTGSAATVTSGEAVETLTALGLLNGTGEGADLTRTPSRSETLAMLIRLLGYEENALAYEGICYFEDVRGTWAEPYAAYADSIGLVNGVSPTFFGGSENALVRDYLTFVLRALGYSEGTDFTWDSSIAFSDSIGLTHGEYSASSQFTREDMALISYTTLVTKLKDSDDCLVDRLYSAGAVSYSQLVSTRLAGHVNIGKKVYTPEEIYERSASAVFLMKQYETKEDYEDDLPSATASGFFITSDGIAVISYHAIDGMYCAVAVTSDGKVYPFQSVLYYDAFRDVAVVRISRESTDGETATYFPYLELGDSDAVTPGESIYCVSAPAGLDNSFSDGIISNASIVLDDERYPCIQHTAPISQGSSGSPLINRYGEVVGIVYAMLASGNSLYFCVPVNSIRGVSLTGSGTSIEQITRHMDELKSASIITASSTLLNLKVGERETITISSNCPVPLSAISYTEGDSVNAVWNEFTNKTTTSLTISALSPGTSKIYISFADNVGNDDFVLTIQVNVTE